MRGILSNEEEIARGILMAHFPLLLRLLFSGCSLSKIFGQVLAHSASVTRGIDQANDCRYC